MFYKKKKTKYTLSIIILLVMIVGGFVLGKYIGYVRLNKKIKEHGGEFSYHSIESTGKKDRGTINPANDVQEFITGGTLLIFESTYTGCGEKIVTKRKAQDNEIGLNLKETRDQFSQWDIKDFNVDVVSFFRKIDGYCPKHYILESRDGLVAICTPSEEGGEYQNIEKTHIKMEILPYEVRKEIEGGIIIDSLEELEHFIENLES